MTWKDTLLKVAIQSATGVQYLHHSRYLDEKADCWKDCIIHRDLKPDNILVTDDFTAKLTDFGEARSADLNLTMTTVGTPIYIAPEILRNDRYDSKVDVYSFGILVATVFNQTEPGDLSSSAVMVGVLGGQLRTKSTKPTSGCNLATSCMLAQVRAFGDAGVGAEVLVWSSASFRKQALKGARVV